MVYCESCGAANETITEKCFVCQQPVVDTEKLEVVPAFSSADPETSKESKNTPTLLQGRYQILKEVGTGGFGAVYKAIDTQFDNRTVAIKEIRLQGLKPNEIIDATDTFNREVNILTELRHPNLPRVYDHFTSPEHWYLAMDFIDGQTLEAYLHSKDGRLPMDEIFTLGIQICTVLDYLHTRQPAIIFRDLKPTNVMITSHKQVYLIDFGAARYFKSGRTKDTIAFGSPGYASPEQYGKAQTTARSDIYSLGATLHEALTGKDPAEDPFHFAPIRIAGQIIPPDLEALIQRMVEMDMSKRPTSAAAVKAELWRISTQHTHRLYAMPGTPSSMPPYRPSFGVGQPPPAAWAQFAPSVQQAQIQLGFTPTPAPRKRGITRRAATSMIILGIASVALLENVRTLWGNQDAQNGGAMQMPASGSGQMLQDPYQSGTFTLHRNTITSLAWSPQGTYVASGSLDKTLRVWNWDIDGTETIHTMSDPVNAVGWSQDGSYVAAASGGKIGELQIWGTATTGGDKPLLTFSEPSSGPINALAWMPSNHYTAIGSNDGNIRLIKADASSPRNVATYGGQKGSVQSMAWSTSGAYLAAGGTDTKVYVWPATLERSLTASGFSQHTDRVTAIAWMGDMYIFSGSADQTVLQWDTKGSILQAYKLFAPVTAIALSPQNILAIGTADGSATFYDANTTDRLFAVSTASGDAVRSIAWSPDGNFFVVGGDDAQATVWSMVLQNPQQGGSHHHRWNQ
jgi:eukaryotic-like serine/threonine-protein kinase